MPGVSDEVWARLDPQAGRLKWHNVLRNWVTIAVAVLLVIAGALVWRTGIVVPRLVWPDGLQQWEENPDWVRIWIAVGNVGRFDVTVLDVGQSGPGFELLGVEGVGRAPSPFPVTLAPGEDVDAVLVYRITDCHEAPVGKWPLTARVDRPWGAMTVEVPAESEPIPTWQEHVISTWCRPGGPGD